VVAKALRSCGEGTSIVGLPLFPIEMPGFTAKCGLLCLSFFIIILYGVVSPRFEQSLLVKKGLLPNSLKRLTKY
jgi:hypothetical protein